MITPATNLYARLTGQTELMVQGPEVSPEVYRQLLERAAGIHPR